MSGGESRVTSIYNRLVVGSSPTVCFCVRSSVGRAANISLLGFPPAFFGKWQEEDFINCKLGYVGSNPT